MALGLIVPVKHLHDILNIDFLYNHIPFLKWIILFLLSSLVARLLENINYSLVLTS